MRYHSLIALAALGFVSLAKAKGELGRPCGFKIAPCLEDQYCKPNNDYCTDLNRCAGTCQFKNTYPDCGGFRPNPPTCCDGTTCKDDPRLPNSCGQACDMPGICVPNEIPRCGGFTGEACPKGLYCYDEPKDGCDPDHGGADCGGICL